MRLDVGLQHVMAALTAFASMGAAPADEEEPCEMDLVPSGYPQLYGVASTVGYDGSYARNDLLEPEPIPLTVDATDVDTILAYCNEVCSPQGVPGAWTAGWTRETPSGFAPGDFLDSIADLVETQDGTAVMFLPPKDLSPGESRDTYVTATIVDDCSIPGFEDNQAEVVFLITVARDAAGLYDVTAVEDTISNPPQSPPDCDGLGSMLPCELLTTRDIGDPPIASIDAHPTSGMILGEMRVFHGRAEDPDEMSAECGPPQGPSNYDYQDYCDELTYTWSVIQGPGNGIFVSQGASTQFLATQPGSVKVAMLVQAPDGEVEQDEVTFTIHEPRLRELTYLNHIPVRADKNGVATTPHWKDMDGDADASDVGEHRHSAAYVRSSLVEIDKVVIECGTKVPPHVVVQGTAPNSIDFRDVKCATFGNPNDLEACGLTASAPLPNRVLKYDLFAIDWEISFGNDNYVPTGTSDTWLYVVLDDPIQALPYVTVESVFDISCLAAQGESDPAVAYEKIWEVFGAPAAGAMPPAIHRKSRDGFNVPDGQRLGYRREGETLALDALSLLGVAEGNGGSMAWAQLFKGCLEVQGNPSVVGVRVDRGAITEPMLVEAWRRNEPFICPGQNGLNESFLFPDLDTEVIELGNGVEGGPGIHPGDDGLQTAPCDGGPGGCDDETFFDFNGVEWIGNGDDGICDTVAQQGDVNVSLFGYGYPHRPNANAHWMAIGAGRDGVLQSTLSGDDHEHPTYWKSEGLITGTQALDLVGLPGHDNDDPPSILATHFVIQSGVEYFDPSYGLGEYATTDEHEDDFLWGLVRTDNPALCDLQDPATPELVYTPLQAGTF